MLQKLSSKNISYKNDGSAIAFKKVSFPTNVKMAFVDDPRKIIKDHSESKVQWRRKKCPSKIFHVKMFSSKMHSIKIRLREFWTNGAIHYILKED